MLFGYMADSWQSSSLSRWAMHDRLSVVRCRMCAMTGCIEFRDDDSGYLAWLAANQQGHVINIARSHNTSQARLHAASCRTIGNRTPMGGSSWTGPYVKVCAEFRADVEQWAVETVGQSIDPCGTCCPPSGVGARSAATRPAESPLRAQVMTARYEIHGPTESTPVVEAWADDYIRFELGAAVAEGPTKRD